MDGKPRLLAQVREQIRLKHYSIRTEQVYCEWVKRFVQLLGDPDFPVRNVRLENVVTDVAFEDFVRVENGLAVERDM